MPRLTITYKDRVMFDDDVSEFSWSESENTIATKARMGGASGGAGNALMNILEKAAASQKSKTAIHASELRVQKLNTPDQGGDVATTWDTDP
jgi:hypothetical protein